MGVFDRFRTKSPPVVAPVALDLDELRDTARTWIRAGFVPYDGFAERLAEYHEDLCDDPGALLAAARSVVDEEWARRLIEQATWAEPGDHERLRAAFEDLEGQGLVCRMSFTCCQTCGTAEIDDERSLRESAAEGEYPYAEWAYVFFHEQDAERLADEQPSLWLSYSAWHAAPGLDPELVERARAGDSGARQEMVRQTDAAVGRKVHEALVGAGLEVDWDGDPARRISVRLRDWRRPLPAGR